MVRKLFVSVLKSGRIDGWRYSYIPTKARSGIKLSAPRAERCWRTPVRINLRYTKILVSDGRIKIRGRTNGRLLHIFICSQGRTESIRVRHESKLSISGASFRRTNVRISDAVQQASDGLAELRRIAGETWRRKLKDPCQRGSQRNATAELGSSKKEFCK
jgi:hypothetical protein